MIARRPVIIVATGWYNSHPYVHMPSYTDSLNQSDDLGFRLVQAVV